MNLFGESFESYKKEFEEWDYFRSEHEIIIILLWKIVELLWAQKEDILLRKMQGK